MKKQIMFTNLLLALVCGLILSTGIFAQVKTWGLNTSGQLGDGTVFNRSSPTPIGSLTDIVDIHGSYHTLAVKANGTVMAWGYNEYGQLGNGTTNTIGCQCNTTPGAVSGLTSIIAVSAGSLHSLALRSDGTVWAWGRNLRGQLGDATATQRLTPVQVGVGITGFNGIIAIDAGNDHNLALKSDGTVWAWGGNSFGQIGNGTVIDSRSPIQITSLSNNILAVSAEYSYSVALTKTGRVYVWGFNGFGQIGNGTAGGNALTPTLNTNISDVAQIQAGNGHISALKRDGTVWAWGYNQYGQIGNGTITTTGCQCIPTPTQSTISGVTAIRAESGDHVLARRQTGTIWAWGSNPFGQIGNGTTSTVTHLVQSAVGSGNLIFGTGESHSLLSVPTIPTPSGPVVRTQLGEGYVQFVQVIGAGNTTITAIDPTTTGLSVPAGLTIAENNQAYNISTTAVTGGNSMFVCLKVTNEYDQTEFNKLHLLQSVGGALVDRTISHDYQKREICSQVTSLSSFVFATETRAAFDFDGDGKTDISIFRPAPGEWWYNKSSNGGNTALQFGTSSDKIVPADYTGDGKTDIAFFRPSTGQWFILRSENLSFYAFPFGASGDTPVPADYDGDGKTDAAVFRESNLTWYIQKSSGGTDILGFGAAGDKPTVADYDGDGKADIAIYRPNSAGGSQWWIRRSSNGSVFALQFGTPTDKPVQGDYTGDGKADIAFWRPSNGNWFILRSEDLSFYAFPFGANGDIPAPGDYDGDGRFDATIFRPSNTVWYSQRTTAGTLIQQFGTSGDRPIPSAFVP